MKDMTTLLSSIVVSLVMLGGGSGCEDKAAADALRQIEELKQKQKSAEAELAKKRQELEDERNKREEAQRKQEDAQRKQGEDQRKLEEESKKLQYLHQTAASNAAKAKNVDHAFNDLKRRFQQISQARYNIDLRQLTQFKVIVDSASDLPATLCTAVTELYKIGLAIRSGHRIQDRSGLPTDCFRNTTCPNCKSGRIGGFAQDTKVCDSCKGAGYLKDSFEFNPDAAKDAYLLRLEIIGANLAML